MSGQYRQGGGAIGLTTPRARIILDGEDVGLASANGYFVIGFDRDAASSAQLTVETDAGRTLWPMGIADGEFDIQRISGLPPSLVSPTDPDLLDRIRREVEMKKVGFASQIDSDGFRDGFSMPLTSWRQSARFGGQRILNGEPKTPHYGADLAAPTGSPILAPADGIVAMSATDMHFEGGLTAIDHGQGLISVYLHQSRIDVRAGDAVVRGQTIGAVGMTGRTTGPHLCWRLKWRGRNLDPMLFAKLRLPAGR